MHRLTTRQGTQAKDLRLQVRCSAVISPITRYFKRGQKLVPFFERNLFRFQESIA
jgi:hypothetical protein